MTTGNRSWRLIDTGPLDGAENMAVDEALLTTFDPERSLPVLRLYGWEPPALSVGRFQRADEVLDLARCAAIGVPVVRRITGGGVIYHAEELTYSIVCAPHHLPPSSSIKESFRLLTSFLCRFYTGLGLDARYAVELEPAGRFGERTPFCFAGRESYDIVINGRKIGGNAQRRLRNVIFQHGSIPLRNMAATGGSFLREEPAGVEQGTTSLADQGVEPEPSRLREELAESFAESLAVSFDPCSLTDGEADAAAGLLTAKYRNEEWNLEGVTA